MFFTYLLACLLTYLITELIDSALSKFPPKISELKKLSSVTIITIVIEVTVIFNVFHSRH